MKTSSGSEAYEFLFRFRFSRRDLTVPEFNIFPFIDVSEQKATIVTLFKKIVIKKRLSRRQLVSGVVPLRE